jgi:acetyl esterase/lipase
MWAWGSKEQYRFVGAALANSGYVAILPNYRLFPQARFPQFIDDGALAVRWAREHARELGGDPGAIFLMGHSAGGHLAATLALDEQYLEKVGGNSSCPCLEPCSARTADPWPGRPQAPSQGSGTYG